MKEISVEALEQGQKALEGRVEARTLDLARSDEQLHREIRQREQVEKSLEERLKFEALLSELSARFVHLLPEEVDREIELALKAILDFFQVDRCGLIRTLPGKDSFQITHLAYSEDVPPLPTGAELPVSIYPWAYNKLIRKREVVAYSRLDDLPSEAEMDKQTWTKWGARSNVNIPILIGEPVDHIISINSVKSERVWPEELFPRLQLLGEIFVNALERKRSHLQLEERLRFERFISDLSTCFVNITVPEVGREITDWLKRISEFFRVDRSSLGLFSKDGNRLDLIYEYHGVGIEPAPVSLSNEQAPWYLERLNRGHPVVVGREDDLPEEAGRERLIFRVKSMKSLLALPMFVGKKTLGSCVLVSTQAERSWPEDMVQRFGLIAAVFANALARRQMEEEVREQLIEIQRLKLELERENIGLRRELQLLFEHGEIVGAGPAIKRVLGLVEQVANTTTTVLLTGETGTGKELVARAIHRLSPRRGKPLITVNCASLPPSLIESELFGREKGAYTGALTRQAGRFEAADGATLFLDEIGELPLELQGKLLRVLEEGRFERLGSTRTIQVDVRVIAATHRDLKKEVGRGNFREDLYYRINVFPIEIPPLRERTEDIPLLVWAFVNEFSEKMGKKIQTVPRKTMEALQRYPWPGNVRELRNVIERALIVSSGDILQVQIPLPAEGDPNSMLTLDEAENQHILGALEKTGWRIKGLRGAAELLGLKPSSLYTTMKRLGIPTKREKDGIAP
jgi:formate hydrogenlyase transcriptional activator